MITRGMNSTAPRVASSWAWVAALRAARRAGELAQRTAWLGAAAIADPDLAQAISAWLPHCGADGEDIADVELVLVVAAAARDEAAARLDLERAVVLDRCLPGWRDPEVRAWLLGANHEV